MSQLRDKTATDADGTFVYLLGPETLKIDADRRKNGDVKDGEKRVWKAFGCRKVQRDAAKSKIDHASALRGLIAEDGVGVGAGHRDTFGFARHGVETRLVRNSLKRRRGEL